MGGVPLSTRMGEPMSNTETAQIHALTSQFLQVGDIYVAPAELWNEDGTRAGSRVAIVLTGTYLSATHTVGEGCGDSVGVTDGDSHDLYVEITADMARRMAELLCAAVDEC